jgi:hypothetical protein
VGEVDGLHTEGLPGRRHADDDERSAAPHAGESLLDDVAPPDRDEGVVHPALFRERANLVREGSCGRIHRVRGAELDGGRALRLRDIRSDDRCSPAQSRALHAVQPDTPRPDDEHALSPLDVGPVHDRTEARDDPAAEEGGNFEGERVRDDRDLRLVDDHLLGERGRVQAVGDGLAVARSEHRAAIRRELVLAEVRLPSHAEEAPPARAEKADDHSVAERHGIDGLADRLDDARGLVPVYGGQVSSPRSVDERDVAVADGARGDPHPHLSLLRSVEDQVLDLERRPERPADRGLHGGSLSSPV